MSPAYSDTTAERQLVFGVLHAALDALGSVVGRHTELVLHDLTQPESSVVAIVNGHVTGRAVGSPVLAGPRHDPGFAAVQQASQASLDHTPVVVRNYPTTSPQGQLLRSATAVFRDANGEPYASLCINADLSGIVAAQACLAELLGTAPRTEPKPVEAPNLELLMAEIIQTALAESKSSSGAMKKQAKLEAVRQMQERGLFIVKGGIEKAAAVLGVTRYTIHNYLNEIRAKQENETHTK